MNRNRIYHGLFGRVVLLDMLHPLITHAHPQPHIIVKIGGCDGAMNVYGRDLPLTSETVVLINAWEPHSYAGSKGGPAFLLAFYPRSVLAYRSCARRAANCASSSIACRERRN